MGNSSYVKLPGKKYLSSDEVDLLIDSIMENPNGYKSEILNLKNYTTETDADKTKLDTVIKQLEDQYKPLFKESNRMLNQIDASSASERSAVERPTRLRPLIGHQPMGSQRIAIKSELMTDQGCQGTCASHGGAKIILQNVYLFVHPLPTNDEETLLYKSCFDMLKTDNNYDIDEIDPAQCSTNGYYKIILFLYLYNLVKNGRHESLDLILLFEILPPALEMSYIPFNIAIESVNHGIAKDTFLSLRGAIKPKLSNITWVNIIMQIDSDIIKHADFVNMIKPILELELYVAANLIAPDVFEHNKHQVIIVSSNGNTLTLINSWGQYSNIINNIHNFMLWDHLFEINAISLLLPMYPTTPLPDFPAEIEGVIYLVNDEHNRDMLKKWIPKYCANIKKYKHNGGRRRKVRRSRRINRKHKRYTINQFL